MNFLEELFEAGRTQFSEIVTWIPRIGLFIAALIITMTIAAVLVRIVRRVIKRGRVIPTNATIAINRVTGLLFYGGALLASAGIAGFSVNELMASFAFLAVGIAFALRVVFEHIFAGIVMTLRRIGGSPMFDDGEYIEIADAAGTANVAASNILWTQLDQPGGQEIIVMNGAFMADSTLVRVGDRRMVVIDFDLNNDKIAAAMPIFQKYHTENPHTITASPMAFKVKPGTAVTGSGSTFIFGTEVKSPAFWDAYDWYSQSAMIAELQAMGALSVFDIGGSIEMVKPAPKPRAKKAVTS